LKPRKAQATFASVRSKLPSTSIRQPRQHCSLQNRWASDLRRDRRPVDVDEDDGLRRPTRAIHPDRRHHGPRVRSDALPHAAGRPETGPGRG